MSNLRPESRIKSLEKRATDIEAAIEELSSDQAEELKAIRQDIRQLNDVMMASFKKIGDTFIDTTATKDDIADLKTTMAMKEDLVALEGRIKEDTGTIETRLDRMESDINSFKTAQDRQESLLQEILSRLPPKS
jgi:uncharacterized coiled-coil protein SlyX